MPTRRSSHITPECFFMFFASQVSYRTLIPQGINILAGRTVTHDRPNLVPCGTSCTDGYDASSFLLWP